MNFHSKCKILGGVTEFFGKAFLCRFPPENLPRPVFTADGFNGTLKECDEGVLEWIPRKKLLELPHWEGDAIFLDLIAQEDTPFFSLKLCYRGEELMEAILNGTYIKGGPSL